MTIKLFIGEQTAFTEFYQGEINYYFDQVFQTKTEEVSSKEEADIVVAFTEEDQLDAIVVNLSEGKGRISATSKSGLLTAIYRFFEEFGVRYLRPGRQNEYVLTHPIEVFTQTTINISEQASYKHRGVCIEGADSFENIKDFIDWLPKVGFNSFFIQFENPYSFLKRWYDHELNPYLDKEPFNEEIAQEMSDLLDDEMNKRGVVHHRVGHGWTGEVLGYSSKYGWESGWELPEEKKPLVAEINGKRELYNGGPIFTSLDFSNPEVTEEMVGLIVDYSKKRKDVDYLHVWLSDAHNNACECAECQKDLIADHYVRVLNRLDERLTEEGLDTKICFLLYHELLFPPQVEVLNNPERFSMMFAPISRTFEKSYADVDYESDIPEIAPYQRNKMVLPNSLEENLSYLLGWQKVFTGDSFVYDYPLGRAHYGDLGYMAISEIIYRDIQYLEKIDLNGYISCQELRAGFPHNFPNYVMGKTLWNKERSYEELKKEYFSAMYGPDWADVTDYLETLSDHSSVDYINGLGERKNEEFAADAQTNIDTAYNFLSKIDQNFSATTGVQKHNWNVLSYHREYVAKFGKALHLLANGQDDSAQTQWKDMLDFIRRSELAIQENFDIYRVIEVTKNYTGFRM